VQYQAKKQEGGQGEGGKPAESEKKIVHYTKKKPNDKRKDKPEKDVREERGWADRGKRKKKPHQ